MLSALTFTGCISYMFSKSSTVYVRLKDRYGYDMPNEIVYMYAKPYEGAVAYKRSEALHAIMTDSNGGAEFVVTEIDMTVTKNSRFEFVVFEDDVVVGTKQVIVPEGKRESIVLRVGGKD